MITTLGSVRRRWIAALAGLYLAGAVVALAVGGTHAAYSAQTTNPNNVVASLYVQTPALGAPSSAAGGVVRLSWPASPTAATRPTGYLVFRRPAGGTTFTQVTASPIAALAYDDTPPADGSYEYVVRATVSTFTSPAGTPLAGLSDRTPPATAATLGGTAGSGGWYRSAVTVTLAAADGSGSGVAGTWYAVNNAACTPAATSACAAYTSVPTVSAEGSHAVYFFSRDKAGNGEAQRSQAFKIDVTAPSVTAAAAAGGSAYLPGGWTNQQVTVSFSCSDAGSGVAGCPGAATLAGEGANQSVTRSATDAAGNTASATLSNINIDLTAPAAASGLTAAAAGTGSVALSWTPASDALSGIGGYDVFVADRSGNACASFSYLSRVGAGSSATVSGLTSGQRYCFYLVSRDVASNAGPASASASARAG